MTNIVTFPSFGESAFLTWKLTKSSHNDMLAGIPHAMIAQHHQAVNAPLRQKFNVPFIPNRHSTHHRKMVVQRKINLTNQSVGQIHLATSTRWTNRSSALSLIGAHPSGHQR